MTNQKRVQPGVSEGGQFTTSARPESDVALTGTSHTGVRVVGDVPADGRAMVDSLSQLNLGPDTRLELDDKERFAANLHTAVATYRVSAYEPGTYRVVAQGAGPNDVLLREGHEPVELAEALRKARAEAINTAARHHADARLRQFVEAPGAQVRPVAARREPDWNVVEVGFALPGDHIKVQAFSDPVDGQLFARSAIKDGLSDLTERQRTNRLNKVLDSIGPDRQTADRALRAYLTDLRDEADRLHAADNATREALHLDA